MMGLGKKLKYRRQMRNHLVKMFRYLRVLIKMKDLKTSFNKITVKFFNIKYKQKHKIKMKIKMKMKMKKKKKKNNFPHLQDNKIVLKLK